MTVYELVQALTQNNSSAHVTVKFASKNARFQTTIPAIEIENVKADFTHGNNVVIELEVI